MFEGVKQILLTVSTALIGASNIFTPQPAVDIQTFQPPNPQEVITISDQFSYFGHHIKYSVYFPKKGGDVKGVVDGACKGVILGTYEPGKVIQVSGSLTSSCKIAFINQETSTVFTGTVNQGEKKIYLDWLGNGFLAGKRGNVALDINIP